MKELTFKLYGRIITVQDIIYSGDDPFIQLEECRINGLPHGGNYGQTIGSIPTVIYEAIIERISDHLQEQEAIKFLNTCEEYEQNKQDDLIDDARSLD